MKKNNKHQGLRVISLLFSLFSLLFVISSCGDFLDPASSDEYVPETATALDEMLVGNAYPDNVNSKSILFFHNALDDDIAMTKENVGFSVTSSDQQVAWFSIFTWQSDMFVRMEEQALPYWQWDSYYEYILGANAALDYADKVNDSEEMKNYVKAQAYGLRAFYYLNLVNLFGAPYTSNPDALGVPLKLNSNLTTEKMARNTVGEVYRQILADFQNAETLFKQLPANRQFAKNYRINLPTVQLLQARTYLYMGEWQAAIQKASEVLSWNQFQLYDLTRFTPQAGSVMPHYSDYNNGETLWHYGRMADFLRMACYVGYPQTGYITRYLFNASPELLATYTDEGDLRSQYYIFDEYYGVTKLTNKKAMGKVVCNDYQTPLSESGFALSVRLSEAYLILAEAYAMTGDAAQSLRYLNELRAKRIQNCQPLSGLQGNDLIQTVRDERRRELCFEGFRWFDLRRWGMNGFSRQWQLYNDEPQTYSLRTGDEAFTLPIPQKAMDRNPGLVQNPLAAERNH